MIKANKGVVQMKGEAIVLEAELMTIVKGLYTTFADMCDEEFAKKRLQAVFDAAIEPEKEEEALEVKLEGDKAEKFAEAFLKTLAAAVERKGEE